MHSGLKFESTNPGIVILSSEMQFLIEVICSLSGVLLWGFQRSEVKFIHNVNSGLKNGLQDLLLNNLAIDVLNGRNVLLHHAVFNLPLCFSCMMTRTDV